MTLRYDVFVSHNALDKPLVERLCLSLLRAGVRPWFDKWDLAFGDQWIKEVERLLAQIPTVLVCVGDHGFSDWHDSERQAAMLRVAQRRSGLVVPVLLPGAPEALELPLFLAALQAVDLRAEHAWDQGIGRLVQAITGKLPAAGADVPVDPDARPYRGLQPFTEADAGWMFGRERDETRLIDELRAGQRFIPLIGASGSGKSSLVRAGVIPTVRTRGVDGAPWHAVVMRPGGRPCSELAARLIELRRRLTSGASGDLVGDTRALAELRDTMMAIDTGLADTVDALLGASGLDAPLLLVVDQFEELFTASGADRASTPEGDAFIRNLLAATQAPGRLRVLVTVRADFTGACLGVPALAERMTRMSFVPPPLGEQELTVAIRRPALRVGYDVEDSLLTALVRATSAQPGRLPLLQHTLDRLWDVRDKTRRLLDFASYEREIGSLEESVARRADEVLAKITGRSVDHEDAVRKVFLRLVHLGEGTGDTRLRVPRRELEGDADSARVLRAFLDARLVVTDTDQDAATEVIEIAHEALISRWGRLQRWIDDRRSDLLVRQDMTYAVRRWRTGGRPSEELWRGSRLAHVRALVEARRLDFTADETEFLKSAREAEDRALHEKEHRQRRLLAATVAVVIVLSVLLAATIYQSLAAQANARENAALADHNADLARQNAAEARKAERAAQREQGEHANFLSRVPGREIEALHLAVRAVGSAGDEPPIEALRGLGESLARARRVLRLGGHAGFTRAAWRPDGLRVATAGADGEGRLWDSATGELLHRLGGHAKAIESLAWGPDGRRLATVSLDWTGRLWDGESGALVAVLDGHLNVVTKSVWAPDGARLVTLSDDGTARLWDGTTGVFLAVLGHQSRVGKAAWSKNSLRLATQGWANSPRLWDGRTGALVAILGHDHDENANGIAWQPTDVPWLATAGNDYTTRLWESTTGALRVKIPAAHERPFMPAWAPDGTRLAIAHGSGRLVEIREPKGTLLAAVEGDWPAWAPDGQALATITGDTAKIWDPATGALRFTLSGHTELLTLAVWSPDGRRLVTYGDDYSVRLWDVGTGKQVAALVGHTAAITTAAWAPDGAPRMVTAGQDGTAAIWDLHPGSIEQTFTDHTGPLTTAIWSPDGDGVVTAGRDGLVMLMDATSAAVERQFGGHIGPVLALAWAPDGARLVTAGHDRTAQIWDARSGEVRAVLNGHKDMVHVVAWSPNGARLATASQDGTVKLWSGSGQLQATLAVSMPCAKCKDRPDAALMPFAWTPRGDVSGLEWSPDSTRLATSSRYGALQIWDAASGALQATFEVHKAVRAITWSPEGARLASTGADGTVALWDARSSERVASLVGHTGTVVALAWSADGRRLASAGEDGRARLWDVATGTSVAVLEGSSRPLTALAWSPDGRHLATVGEDATVRLWNSDGTPLATFEGHTGTIHAVAWSPDGGSLLTASEDGTAIRWLAEPDRWLARGCELLVGSVEFTPELRAICEGIRRP